MFWRHYAEFRDRHAYDLIGETCRDFEHKHVPGWGYAVRVARSLESDSSEMAQHNLPQCESDHER